MSANVPTRPIPAAASTRIPGRNCSVVTVTTIGDDAARPRPPSPPPPQSIDRNAAPTAAPSKPSPSQSLSSAAFEPSRPRLASSVEFIATIASAPAAIESAPTASGGVFGGGPLRSPSRNASMILRFVNDIAACIRKCSASMFDSTTPYVSLVYASAGMDATTNSSSVANDAFISSVAVGAAQTRFRNARYGATESANSGDAIAHHTVCWSTIASRSARASCWTSRTARSSSGGGVDGGRRTAA
mmetsp:Transcript_12081/g.43533  ORF Transcript_12081/g.43533 Transcript_12081/m.43533 type:complete len:244 (+) Transcript_12081:451-1182(+)